MSSIWDRLETGKKMGATAPPFALKETLNDYKLTNRFIKRPGQPAYRAHIPTYVAAAL